MDRRSAKLAYKLSHRPMGVFQIRNTIDGKVFVDSSTNIPGKINRHTFALRMGRHASKSLQGAWLEHGSDAFAFETLEPLEPRDDPEYNYAADLRVLEDLWLEKLHPYGEEGYNKKQLTSEERLERISKDRSSEAARNRAI